jgi:hypothetical protein
VQENLPDVEWTLEEKRARCAQMIINQPERHCFLKLDTQKTQSMTVESVEEYGLSEQSLLEYQGDVYKVQGARSADDVDLLLGESHQAFLAAAAAAIEMTSEYGESASSLSGDSPQKVSYKNVSEQPQIWSRVLTGASSQRSAAESARPSPARQPNSRGSRGPKTAFDNHAKVDAIVRSYGQSWATADNLLEICEKLDNAGVPIPKNWPTLPLRDHPAHSWRGALLYHRDLVKKAIRYSCQKAPTAAIESESELPPISAES